MKQITFGASAQPTYLLTIHDVRDTVIEFLIKNGMLATSADKAVSISPSGYDINIGISCANGDFTRALALFQLIFADNPNPRVDSAAVPGFIRYTTQDCGFTLRIKSHFSHAQVIAYIKAHMEVIVN
jgi:hypothetical protein